MPKRMRLPNGFGQISKLNQRLRKPYRAMVTTSWTDEGKPVRRIVGYYHTYNEAYSALMEYHKNPLEPDKDIDMVELYEQWSKQQYAEYPKSEISYGSAWKRCEAIYPMKVRNVKPYHIKQVVEADMPPSMHDKMHGMFNLMFDYAVEWDIVQSNPSRLAHPHYEYRKSKKSHFAFNKDEIDAIWEHMDLEMADAMLIQIYTGFRPQELMGIKNINVDLDNWVITAGLKTAAGIDRTVPIHDRIKALVEARYDPDEEYLFGGMNYDGYKNRFVKIREQLKMDSEHKPHDGRVTFVTLAKKYNVDEYAIKRIVGHAIRDITEETYTERDIEWLRSEISKIP